MPENYFFSLCFETDYYNSSPSELVVKKRNANTPNKKFECNETIGMLSTTIQGTTETEEIDFCIWAKYGRKATNCARINGFYIKLSDWMEE